MPKRSVPVLLPSLLVLGLLGAWAGTSMGQLPPVPTVSIPSVTVTVPTVPVPPAPPAPPPPPVPPVTTPAVTTPGAPPPPVEPPKTPVPLPVPPPPVTRATPQTPGTPVTQSSQGSGSGPSGGGGTGGTVGTAGVGGAAGSAPVGRQYGASSRIATVSRFRTSRRWVTMHGPEAGRGLWISFWMSRAGTVVFLVDQLAPDCRYVGQFLVRARAGRNAVRFNGRVGGRTIDSGTYRLTAYPRANRARPLTGVTVVMLARPARPAEVAAAQRNTCPRGIPPSNRDATGAGPAKRSDPTKGVAGVQAAAASGRPYDDSAGGPLGAAVETIQAAADAVPPVLIALALLSVLLLALAAMPQPIGTSRAGAALVHHRGTLALSGLGVLGAAILSFALL